MLLQGRKFLLQARKEIFMQVLGGNMCMDVYYSPYINAIVYCIGAVFRRRQGAKDLHRCCTSSQGRGERVCVCCLLVLNSVTSTPQWIRQPEAAWGLKIAHDH